MTDTDQMVTWLRAAMDTAQRDAEAAPDGPRRAVDTPFGPEVHVGDGDDLDGKWTREGLGVDAAYRCDDPYDDCADARHGYVAEARLHAAHADPAAVLRRIAADRQLLDDLLTEQHNVVEDPAYTCPAATTERDGGRNYHPGPCDCGRNERVQRRVRLLAEGYGWTEETK